MESYGKMRNRTTIHQSLEEGIRETESDSLNGQESDVFEMKRGTKQGDPLSSLLFNTVLQMALRDDVERWQKPKGMAICSGDSESDCLTNLRFADDVPFHRKYKQLFFFYSGGVNFLMQLQFLAPVELFLSS